jgi:hypothetical protein
VLQAYPAKPLFAVSVTLPPGQKDVAPDAVTKGVGFASTDTVPVFTTVVASGPETVTCTLNVPD